MQPLKKEVGSGRGMQAADKKPKFTEQELIWAEDEKMIIIISTDCMQRLLQTISCHWHPI